MKETQTLNSTRKWGSEIAGTSPADMISKCFRMYFHSNCVGNTHAYRHTAAAVQLPLKLLEIKSLTKALCCRWFEHFHQCRKDWDLNWKPSGHKPGVSMVTTVFTNYTAKFVQ